MTIFEIMNDESMREPAKVNAIKYIILKIPEIVHKVDGERGATPLYWAIHFRLKEVFQLLLDKGADVNALTKDSDYPIHVAAMRDDSAMFIPLLTKAGANANTRATKDLNSTPLHKAAYNGQVKAVKALIHAGADIELKTTEEKTALHMAAMEGHSEIITVLLDAGADIEARDAKDKNTPLVAAVWFGKLDAITTLLNKGANIESLDNHGNTPLGAAASQNQLEAVKLLLRRKANIYHENDGPNGMSIVEIAQRSEKGQDVVRFLQSALGSS